eukprot:CAMPEP_0178836068 /NCGR_PEP_ID=MMETSP0746-20121128/11974_1 /TAXON_ID=913974 /ORGANISM="Nitzschia punctata, Strain CCMP561" /LENGTH=446 /DNA_ID=CAMNT_0020498707 /DNA_START=186 /DNA_END=1523 /DNA_ORIENTATION=+
MEHATRGGSTLPLTTRSSRNMPMELLIDSVLPYVSDRATWNSVALTRHEVRDGMIHNASHCKWPWPERIRLPKPLGFGSITAIEFSPSSTMMACGTMSRIDVYDACHGHLCQLQNRLHGTIKSIAFSPSYDDNDDDEDDNRICGYDAPRLMAASSTDSNPRVWQTQSFYNQDNGEGINTVSDFRRRRHNNGIELRLKEAGGGMATKLQFSPNGRYLLCTTQSNELWACNIATGQFCQAFSLGVSRWFSRLMAVTVHPQTGAVMVATSSAVLKLVHLLKRSENSDDRTSDGTTNRILDHSADTLTCFSFSPCGSHAVAGGNYGFLKLWKNIRMTGSNSDSIGNRNMMGDDSPEENDAIRLRGLTSHVNSVAFSCDGQWVAASGMSGAVKVWNVPLACSNSVYPVASLFDPSTSKNDTFTPIGVNTIAFTPDGNMLAATGNDGSIRFW